MITARAEPLFFDVRDTQGSVPVGSSGKGCGFLLLLKEVHGKVSRKWKALKSTTIFCRQSREGNRLRHFDFSKDQILPEGFRSEFLAAGTKAAPTHTSGDWMWADGKQGFLTMRCSWGMENS